MRVFYTETEQNGICRKWIAITPDGVTPGEERPVIQNALRRNIIDFEELRRGESNVHPFVKVFELIQKDM